MITIHHLKTSRSERIIWLAEELGLPYELKTYERTPSSLAPDAYKSLHPMGRAPIIRDGDVTLMESGAIIEYILSRYGGGKLRPVPDAEEYPAYLQWLHFAEGSSMSSQILMFLLDMGAEAGVHHPRREMVNARVLQEFGYMNDVLEKRPFFAGETFTGADINMTFTVRFARDWAKRDLATFPNLVAYMTRIEARPAYKKAMSLA